MLTDKFFINAITEVKLNESKRNLGVGTLAAKKFGLEQFNTSGVIQGLKITDLQNSGQ